MKNVYKVYPMEKVVYSLVSVDNQTGEVKPIVTTPRDSVSKLKRDIKYTFNYRTKEISDNRMMELLYKRYSHGCDVSFKIIKTVVNHTHEIYSDLI